MKQCLISRFLASDVVTVRALDERDFAIDGQVLEDLRTAEDAEAVTASTFQWQGGVGYEIRPGKRARELVDRASRDLEECADALDWVLREFGNRAASDLEVASTIVYMDRAVGQSGQRLTADDMVSRVREVKPHHEESKIQSVLADLRNRELLGAVA